MFGKTKRPADRRAQQASTSRRLSEEQETAEFRARRYARARSMMKVCAYEVYPTAFDNFRSALSDLPERGAPEFEPMLWLLHFETLSNAYRTFVGEDLGDIPLVVWDAGETGADLISQDWIEMVEDQARLIGLPVEELGRILCEGFRRSLEQAAESNRITEKWFAPKGWLEKRAADRETMWLVERDAHRLYVAERLAAKYEFVFGDHGCYGKSSG
jgi:hypothetical protein